MTKNEQKYNNFLKEENERIKTLLLCFMSALGKVQTVEELESIMLIPIMLEENNKFRAELKAEAYKEFAERVKLEFYYEFDELIPSIMADKIDNLLKELIGE